MVDIQMYSFFFAVGCKTERQLNYIPCPRTYGDVSIKYSVYLSICLSWNADNKD